jgi:hypothetical protein
VRGVVPGKGGHVVIIIESAMMCRVLFQGREEAL